MHLKIRLYFIFNLMFIMGVALLAWAESATPTEPKLPLVNMKQGPVVLFEDACARCHGPYGTFYGDEFAQLIDDRLEYIVWEMMVGPSQLTVNDTEVEAMTEYHKAVRGNVPFATLNNAKDVSTGKTDIIRGDKTPNASVVIQKDTVFYETEIDNKNTWILKTKLLPPFKVIVKDGDQQTSFMFPQSQWSSAIIKQTTP